MDIQNTFVIIVLSSGGSEVEYFMCLDKYEDNDYKGLYSLCCNESDWREQAKLARQIANLPERENV